MKLSVIIPFYNELDLIARAVDSVFAQSVADIEFEVLICNDGTIPAGKIIEALSDATRDRTTVIANGGTKGPGGARNAGLNACTGELIAFLDADDYWLPSKLAGQIKMRSAGYTFIASGYRFDRGSVEVIPPKAIDRPMQIFRRRGIGTSTVLVSREVVGERRFRNLRFAQDIDFWYALAQSNDFRYASVDSVGVVYSTGGSTKNKFVQLKFMNKVLSLNRVSLFDRISVMSIYIVNGVINHYIKRRL